jgi:predicted  nucleic acid-binding Zn-ribbon protein
MSSLLEQAIVDASALKEAALKNAEASVIEKYSDEVKKNLDQILEQDDMGLGALAGDVGAAAGPDAGVDVPLGAAEGEDLCPCPDEDEETEIEINFDELAEALKALNEEVENLEEDSEEEINEVEVELAEEEEEIEEETEMDSLVAAIMEKLSEELEEPIEEGGGAELAGSAAAAVADKESLESEEGEDSKGDSDDDPGSYAGEEGQATNEDIDIDSLVDSIVEKLTVDMGAELAGWAGRSSEDQKFQMEKEIAHRRSTEVQEELEDLKKAQEELVFENNQLSEKIQNYENVVEQLKETVYDVNLSNARLLYTNRVLRNNSLNERQKTKIVDAISKAGSVNEAKTIFETLQSTVESKPKRRPETLGEAIRSPSSVIRASRKAETQKVDPVSERMKKLAGII